MDYIDESLYPDEPSPNPTTLSDFEKAEHIHRVCSAWEFDIPPEEKTLNTIAGWRDILDRFPLPNHLAYHTLRALLHMPPIPGNLLELPYERFDAQENREDPCLLLV